MSSVVTPTARTRAQLRTAAQNAASAAAAASLGQQQAAPAAALDTTALLVQLLQQQHLQAVLTNANSELAAAEALAQQRRASAGPPPTFNGTRTNDELAVNTWLDAMESWFALAHVDIDADGERIEIAVASLRGSAQQWWAATRAADAATVAAGGTTAIDKWANVVTSLRKHYLPQDPARWAIQQLGVLTNGHNADVQAYTNRFLQLDLMIVGPRNELERLMTYEQGLPEGYRVKSAEKQHTTLAAAIASSLALWNAKSVARAQSHGSSRQGGVAKINNSEIDDSGNEELSAKSSRVQNSAGAASSSSVVEKLEQKLDAFISAMQMQYGKSDRRGEGSRRGRRHERQHEGAPRPARSKTPGVSDELARQRLQAGVCIKCAEPGHYARDCRNEGKSN
jgi:hypothetical protein